MAITTTILRQFFIDFFYYLTPIRQKVTKFRHNKRVLLGNVPTPWAKKL